MKIQTTVKWVMFTLMCFVSSVVMAQSGADKLFMEGQQLQKVMKVASQKSAIKKFQQAKVLYNTADKKTMCDNQISICNSNITQLNRPKTDSAPVEKKEELTLSQETIVFEGDKSGTSNVAVTAATMEWVFNIPEGVEGEEAFATITRSSDAKSIDIAVEANPLTIERRQTFTVTFGSVTKPVLITQSGKTVTLSTSKNLLEYGLKGGTKTLDLFTNSDSIIASNNDLTWYVESKPDWVEINVDVQKKKGIFEKGFKAVKGVVAGKVAASEASDVKTSGVNIQVMPLIKADKEFSTGRKGEIIFASQDKRYKVMVVQQK
jgi:hypothetical protein